jgi:type II secretory pathway pseudopilin PulG
MTLIEMLVASAMAIVILGGVSTVLVGAVRKQPEISERGELVQQARWVLERMTRELRDGITLKSSSASTITFEGYVRHTSCGSTAPLSPSASAIVCKITYSCSTTSCTRSETTPADAGVGTPVPIFSGIDSGNVFAVESSEDGGTFVGINLSFPNPEGDAHLNISDGATLRGGDPFGA